MSARVGLLLVLVLVAYTGFFARNHLRGPEFERASFEQLVRGEAVTPMQYRVLVPFFAGLAEPLVASLPLIGDLGRVGEHSLESDLERVKLLFEFVWVFSLLASFLGCTWVLLGELEGLRVVGSERVILASAATFLFMLALPFHFLWSTASWYYPYDVPSLVFFVVGATSALTGRWLVFYPVFVLATLNRETSCFLTILLVLSLWGRAPLRRILVHASVQAGLWVAIKVALWMLYRDGADPAYADVGGLFKNTITANVTSLTRPGTYVMLAAVYGYLWVPFVALFPSIQSPRLKAALWVVPIFHLVMFVPGEIAEIRIYAEMLPLVVWGIVAGALGASSSRAAEATG